MSKFSAKCSINSLRTKFRPPSKQGKTQTMAKRLTMKTQDSKLNLNGLIWHLRDCLTKDRIKHWTQESALPSKTSWINTKRAGVQRSSVQSKSKSNVNQSNSPQSHKKRKAASASTPKCKKMATAQAVCKSKRNQTTNQSRNLNQLRAITRNRTRSTICWVIWNQKTQELTVIVATAKMKRQRNLWIVRLAWTE